ncbi:MAG: pantetheine-phosphate adenylyltransferase [Clostridiaceae bacterium]|nr:pantetheine-phosphate adenylyltransferase [Clostridiaceae bacterium]
MNSGGLEDIKRMVFPGTFDPFTSGHLDVVERALPLCDQLYVAVFDNANKRPAADRASRLAWIRKALLAYPAVQVLSFDGLLVDFCHRNGVTAIVRGLRSAAQFEEEQTMAEINRRIGGGIETVFLPSLPDKRHLSSSAVRELLRLGGDITGMVPTVIEPDLVEHYGKRATE